ncbi:hypothetical protein EDB19DRAFT_1714295 [Suillus lakei]|nr:hypothetical protein EDB19DRAFT_1714295 [Suillus lakei]
MSSSIDPVARNIAILTSTHQRQLTTLMVLEYPYRQIWPPSEAKIYVVTRYAGLAGQSFNIWFAFRMLSGVSNSPSACRVWYSYQTGTIECLLLSVELLLMMRGSSFSCTKCTKKTNLSVSLLLVFGGAQFTAMAVNAPSIVTGNHYSPTCVIISPHQSRIYVGVSIIATFVFVLVAMLWRYFGSTPEWSAEVPRAWLKLVVLIFIFMFLCTTHVIDTQMSGNLVFYVLLSCLWFAAGRIVLHQERFRKLQESKKGSANDPSRWTITIEVDLDDMIPFDAPDIYPESPSDLKVESTEVSTFDSVSDVGTRDITDEHHCELEEDHASLSSRAPTFMIMERAISDEGSGSRK